MGRGKIEIKRIENSSNRQVTYSKRRNGIIKKAKEITVLCDAKVSLVIVGSSGKLHEYCSPNSSVVEILDRFHQQSGQRLWDAKHENLSHEIEMVKKENDNMQIELRHLRGEDITSIPLPELIKMEAALDQGLVAIRNRQNEIYSMHQKNEKMLEDENRELTYVFQQRLQQQMTIDQGNMKGMENNPFDGKEDYHNHHHHHPHPHQQQQHQNPFGFKVQPMQPNLQERM